MQWGKFKGSYMFNKVYHLRRTKMIVYQIAMILCVCSESVGTAALSGMLTLQPPASEQHWHISCQIMSINKTVYQIELEDMQWFTTTTSWEYFRTISSLALPLQQYLARGSSLIYSGLRERKASLFGLLGRSPRSSYHLWLWRMRLLWLWVPTFWSQSASNNKGFYRLSLQQSVHISPESPQKRPHFAFVKMASQIPYTERTAIALARWYCSGLAC